MGKRYLRYSRRHTPRFRHLKRVWAKVGQINVDAPNIGPPVQNKDGTVTLEVIFPAPAFATAYTITGATVPVDPDTGEWGTPVAWSCAPTALAGASSAAVALAIAAAINAMAGAPVDAVAAGSKITLTAAAADTIVASVKALGRATAAPAMFNAEEGEAVAEPTQAGIALSELTGTTSRSRRKK
jgi:hypothetical protein